MTPNTVPTVPIRSANKNDTIQVPVDVYESIEETAEILADKEVIAQIAKSEEQIASGETVSWKFVKAELGLCISH